MTREVIDAAKIGIALEEFLRFDTRERVILREWAALPAANKAVWRENAAKVGISTEDWVVLPAEARTELLRYARQQLAIAYYKEHPELKPRRKATGAPRKERKHLSAEESKANQLRSKKATAAKALKGDPERIHKNSNRYERTHRAQRTEAQRLRRAKRREEKIQAISGLTPIDTLITPTAYGVQCNDV